MNSLGSKEIPGIQNVRRVDSLTTVWLVPVAALLVFGAYLAFASYNEYQETLAQEFRFLESHAHFGDVEITAELRSLDLLLQRVIDDSLAAKGLPQDLLRRRQVQLLEQFREIHYMITTDERGQVVTAESLDDPDSLPAVRKFNAANREYFTVHRDATAADFARYHLSRPFLTITGRKTITFSRAIRGAKGEFKGVALVSMSPDYFKNVLSAVLPPEPSSKTTLFNHFGDIIYRLPALPAGVGPSIADGPGFQVYLHSGERLTRYTGSTVADDAGRLVAFSKIGDTDLGVAVSRQSELVLAGWRNNLWLRILSFALTAAVTFALIVDVRRRARERRRARLDLEQYHRELEETVAERTHSLSIAKDAAEAATRAKGEFVANMSHEIRTPLYSITGLGRLIMRSGVNEEQAAMLDKIDMAGKHLLGIINSILDMSKIDADKLTVEETEVNVEGVLSNVLIMLSGLAEFKKLKLVIKAEPQQCNFLGDANRIQQALMNFATNAIKFTETGSVTLHAATERDLGDSVLMRFEVRDTGIGIDAEIAERLFAPFEQADGSITRKYGGTGLGLVITRKLAQLMGGDAGLISRPLAGSTFWFTARLKKGVRIATLPAPVPAPAPVSSETAEAVLQREFAGTRLLLVDDDEDNLEITLQLLKSVWPRMDVARDGVEAVALATRNDYDLVLMDMQMPKMDGMEATRRIRAVPERKHLPIVAMTANVFPEDRARCIDSGMNDFIVKALDPEAAFVVILKWLAHSRATQTRIAGNSVGNR